MTGTLACWFAPRLWLQARALARARTPYVTAAGLLVVFAVAATILELALSARRLPGGDAPHAVTAAAAAGGAAASAPPAQSMQAAVAGLEARLTREGGADADWELLAKAYEFLGRADAAQRARAHVASPSSDLAAGASGPMTAPAWADYADVLAALAGGSLAGAAGSAIDQALSLDPANSKALWLKASQAHEQHHFVDALAWWHRLRAVLPPDSPDVQIIDGNIAEDTELGGAGSRIASGSSPPAVIDRKVD